MRSVDEINLKNIGDQFFYEFFWKNVGEITKVFNANKIMPSGRLERIFFKEPMVALYLDVEKMGEEKEETMLFSLSSVMAKDFDVDVSLTMQYQKEMIKKFGEAYAELIWGGKNL